MKPQRIVTRKGCTIWASGYRNPKTTTRSLLVKFFGGEKPRRFRYIVNSLKSYKRALTEAHAAITTYTKQYEQSSTN